MWNDVRLAVAALALAGTCFGATTSRADIRMVACDREASWSKDDDGVQLIRRSVDRLHGYLPRGLNVDVMVCAGNVFAQRAPARDGERHLLLLGGDFMIAMYNSWTEEFGWYDADEPVTAEAAKRKAAAAFEAFLEWSFYHEVGHAVLDHDNRYTVERDKPSRRYHERFADSFATITMLRASQDQGYSTALAASGILVLAIPKGNKALDGIRWRNLDAPAPDIEVDTLAWKGLKSDAHFPNELRAWEILCLLYGANLVEDPGEYQPQDPSVYAEMEGHVEGTFPPIVCERDDFSEWSRNIDSTRSN